MRSSSNTKFQTLSKIVQARKWWDITADELYLRLLILCASSTQTVLLTIYLMQCGVISPRFDVQLKDLEKWQNNLLPSRQFG